MRQILLAAVLAVLISGNFVATNLFTRHEVEHVQYNTAALLGEIREQRALLDEYRVLLNTAACASVLGVAMTADQDPTAMFREATRVGSPGTKGLNAEGVCYPKDLTGTK